MTYDRDRFRAACLRRKGVRCIISRVFRLALYVGLDVRTYDYIFIRMLKATVRISNFHYGQRGLNFPYVPFNHEFKRYSVVRAKYVDDLAS